MISCVRIRHTKFHHPPTPVRRNHATEALPSSLQNRRTVLVLLTACIIFSTVRTPTVAVGAGSYTTAWPGGFFSSSSGPTATLLSQGRPVVASSAEGPFAAANAVDGNASTRWGSAFTNNEWIYVDLGSTTTISRVVLNWEAAYGSGYQIQVSDNATTWTTIFTTTTGNGGIDDLTVSIRPLRPHARYRPRHPVGLFPLRVPGLRHSRRAATLLSQGRPVVASSAEGPRGCQWSTAPPAPAGAGIHQQRVDLRRPGLHRHHQPRGAELGSRLRQRLSDPGLQQRDDLDHHLHHHHRQRRRR